MDKYKQLRDAIAAGPTKGIWVQDNKPYIVSDFQITTQDRIDESFGGICAMEVDFDGEFGTEQKANAAYICAANPATVAALLAERDEVEIMFSMIDDREWAEHVGQTEFGSKVESTLTSLLNEIQQLQAERNELLKDKERLDYIVNFGCFFCVEDHCEYEIYEAAPESPCLLASGRNYREAIDKAIAKCRLENDDE